MKIRRLKNKFATDVNSLSCALANYLCMQERGKTFGAFVGGYSLLGVQVKSANTLKFDKKVMKCANKIP